METYLNVNFKELKIDCDKNESEKDDDSVIKKTDWWNNSCNLSTPIKNNIHHTRTCKCKAKSKLRPAKLILPSRAKFRKRARLTPASLILNKVQCCDVYKIVLKKHVIEKKHTPFISEGKVLEGTKPCKDFKSFISKGDSEIVNAFNSMSFKTLPSSEVSLKSTKNNYCIPALKAINDKNSGNTCSTQARLESSLTSSSCDDTTIDELASYFDLLVHIPKKMSTMAEMMYI